MFPFSIIIQDINYKNTPNINEQFKLIIFVIIEKLIIFTIEKPIKNINKMNFNKIMYIYILRYYEYIYSKILIIRNILILLEYIQKQIQKNIDLSV